MAVFCGAELLGAALNVMQWGVASASAKYGGLPSARCCEIEFGSLSCLFEVVPDPSLFVVVSCRHTMTGARRFFNTTPCDL